MARDIETILKQLGLDDNLTYSELIAALEKNNVITDNEINNIINTSVKPLPNIVKNRPDYVKQKMYFPIIDEELGFASVFNKRIVLLKELIKQLHTNAEVDKTAILAVIDELINDLNTGVLTVARAIADENGRNIIETYSEKEEVNAAIDEIINGDVVVGKAEADANGNKFIDVYATKQMLEVVRKLLEDDLTNKLSQYLPLSGGFIDWVSVGDALNVDGTAYLHGGIGLNGGAIFLDGNKNDTRITVNGEELAFVSEIVDGFITAKKAEQDSDGNRIVDTYIKVNQKGTANGVATLDVNCKIPSSQLPSYVDDVMEYTKIDEFPATGESGKIYLETSTNKTYRWSGSKYGEISSSIALGETSSTAYAGDKGKANAEAIKDLQDNKVGKDEAFLKVDGQEVVASFEIATSDEIDTESENQVPTSKAVQSMIENSLGNIESLLEVI